MSDRCMKYNHSLVNKKILPLPDDSDVSMQQIPVIWIQIKGRKEHESIVKDANKCNELGLDQVYETIVYLKKWGGWLS